MATHSSVLAWRIPGTGETGGLPSMGSHRVRHDWSNLAAAALWEIPLVASLVAAADKEFACNAGDPGSIPGSGCSPGERIGYPLQYSCLENLHGQRSLVCYSPCGHKELDMIRSGQIRSVAQSCLTPKYWSFSFNISPPNEYSGLISFRLDCLDLLAIQGTLKSLLQHHSSKASILQCSAFFIVQLSHPWLLENHSFDYMDICCLSNVSAF